MKVRGSAPAPIPAFPSVGALARLTPAGAPRPSGLTAARAAGLPDPWEEPLDRVARLAAMVLGTPTAFVILDDGRVFCGQSLPRARTTGDRQRPAGHSLGRRVIDSGDKLIICDARLDPRTAATGPVGRARVAAWAGLPVRGPDGLVLGALCVADHLPRQWSAGDEAVLEILAHFAASEVALRVALGQAAERGLLAQTLQESLLPPRLPEIPGLEVAARYVAGGTGAEVLGDFFDVFPSVRGSWGLVVGDVCGKGVPAARSTALARYTLRAEAHRQGQPSLILAALNQALLDWLTDNPLFLTAIYATVRPTPAGAVVRISSGGHPLALVRRSGGRLLAFGRPGTLLGLIRDPELHDSRLLLRAGDSLVLFTDGVTEARSHIDRDLYGEDRLRGVIAALGQASAAKLADAIHQDVLAYSGGVFSDDTVILVLKVPCAGAASGGLDQAGDGAEQALGVELGGRRVPDHPAQA